MPKLPKVKVYFNSTLHHFSQLLAGLEYLSTKNEIELKYALDLGKYPIDIFKIEYNGLKLFFDMADNSRIYNKIYEESDFYVKRMLLKTDYNSREKLIPYGLYYPVYFRNSYLKYLFLQNKDLAKYSIKYWAWASKFLKIKDSIAVNEISKLESEPSHYDKIIFRARLWNPNNNKENWKKKERKVLNAERIAINRIFTEQFENSFKGGILKDNYSEKICPDILLPEKHYHRKVYLEELRHASIGIANQGLEDSIGAKFGEYIANSLAIITSPIDKFKLHGNFEENVHYLTYHSSEECLQLTKRLFENKPLRKSMQFANLEYYRNYLHPAKKMMHIFNLISRS